MADRPSPAPSATPALPSADRLRAIVRDKEERERRRAEAERRAADQIIRRARLAFFTDVQISDKEVRDGVLRAEKAAANGLRQIVVMTFPIEFLSDQGRAVLQREPEWRATLTGAAAAFRAYFDAHLAPLGYHLSADVTRWDSSDLADVRPREVSIFLNW